jgi:hypothetical protein
MRSAKGEIALPKTLTNPEQRSRFFLLFVIHHPLSVIILFDIQPTRFYIGFEFAPIAQLDRASDFGSEG